MTIYTLHLRSTTGAIPNTAIENVALKDCDWLRLPPGTFYFVSSALVAKILGERIKTLIPANDSFFLSEANIGNRSGFLPKMAVDWLKKYDNS